MSHDIVIGYHHTPLLTDGLLYAFAAQIRRDVEDLVDEMVCVVEEHVRCGEVDGANLCLPKTPVPVVITIDKQVCLLAWSSCLLPCDLNSTVVW